jgi:hypothetical protein
MFAAMTTKTDEESSFPRGALSVLDLREHGVMW